MSRIVKIGGFSHVDCVQIGGDLPIVIQTMWKDRLSFSNIDEAAAQIASLKSLGCDLLRFAVPDIQNAEVLGHLAQMVSMPLAADIHFDYKIALRCLDFPIAKIRINPGNIGSKDKVEAVLGKAASGGIPIRIGVNAGSLPQDLRLKVEEGMAPSAALVEAAEREISLFKEFNFDNFLVSMKASTIADTIIANRLLSGRCDAPLHAGVTEAGPLTAGVVRNTAALVTLLAEGIGDTIRVSLTDDPVKEIKVAKTILKSLGLRKGLEIISCPTCGRTDIPLIDLTKEVEVRLKPFEHFDISVAVMGCEVNGPGEASHADYGIAGGKNEGLIFRKGEIIKKVSSKELVEELLKIIINN